MATTKKMSTTKKVAAVGAGLGLLAAGAAAYFFTGEGGDKNRAKVKAWARTAKKEVVAELKKMEKVSQKAYGAAVDAVLEKYHQVENIDKADIVALAKEMKSHWKSISSHMTDAVAKAEKNAKTSVNKVAKKVVKATSKK